MPKPLVVNCIDSLLHVITKNISLSLSTGYFSDEWKCAYKKPGLDLTFKNYRSVRILQFLSKLTERAVYERAHLYIETIYPLLQSEYRKQHSTETPLLKVFIIQLHLVEYK